MVRIVPSIPTALPFRTEIRVRATDLNVGNHLGNDRLLAFLQEARAERLAGLVLSQLED